MPLTYNPSANEVAADTNSTVHSNAVYLGDEIYPDGVLDAERNSMFGDDNTLHPDYDETNDAGGIRREIIFTPGPSPDAYAFTLPAAGAVDLSTTRDIGGIPGTVYENVFHGPVTGNPMDEWDVGKRQQLQTQIPGNTGPVTGSPAADYAHTVSYAAYQQMFSDYNPGASADALIAAI